MVDFGSLFHGQAKIAYARRQFPQALKLFQRVLQLNPNCLPDPRIGIGLCFWAMDHKAKAKTAWQRSVEVVSCFRIPMKYTDGTYVNSRILENGPHNFC